VKTDGNDFIRSTMVGALCAASRLVRGHVMTTCIPIRPFRCWQYRKDSTEPVPEWVSTMRVTSSCGPIDARFDRHWFVEHGDFGAWRWYTPTEFAERFKVEHGDLAEAKALIRYAIEDIRGRTPDYDMRAAMLRFVEEGK
jgi:hypothetical protein